MSACTVCSEPLPEPAPTGQRLARKCKRHYVEVNMIVLAMYSASVLPRGIYTAERVQVTALQGNGFSYRLAIGIITGPSLVGQCRLVDEGVWWTRALDEEAAGALRATHALAS
jgi:hypothetical protein